MARKKAIRKDHRLTLGHPFDDGSAYRTVYVFCRKDRVLLWIEDGVVKFDDVVPLHRVADFVGMSGKGGKGGVDWILLEVEDGFCYRYPEPNFG